MADELAAGLHERLLTATVQDALFGGLGLAPSTSPIASADEPAVLTRYLTGVIHGILARQKDSGKRLELANTFLEHLRHDDKVLDPAKELLALIYPRDLSEPGLRRRGQVSSNRTGVETKQGGRP